MPKLTSQACPNCGAPLALSEGATTVTCEHCGRSIHVEWNRRAPVGGPAPLTIYVPTHARVSFLVLLTVLAMLAGMGVSAGYFLMARGKGGDHSAQVIARGERRPRVEFPATCGPTRELEIENRVFEGSGTLVKVESNCKVKIKRSQLKGDIVVLADDNATIEITNSSLEGHDTAVQTGRNGKIRVSEKSVLKGKAAAVDAGMNAQLTFADSRFEGQEVAIQGNKNVEAAIKRCHVQGQQYAVKSDVNLKLQSVDSTFEGGRAAVTSGTNLEFVGQGAKVRGTDAAFLIDGFMPSIKLTGGALVETKGTAVDAAANLKLYLDDARIDAGRIGVDAKANALVEMRAKSRIHAGQVGLLLTVNADISMRDSTLQSDKHAICAEINTSVVADNASIVGQLDALRMQAQPRRFSVGTSHIVGKKNYSAKDCGI